MYQVQRPSKSVFLPVRTLDYHVRLWGEPGSGRPPLVLVHGWMDVAASWQFMVDAFGEAFAAGRQIVAPDWRGFGLSLPPGRIDHYSVPDYLGDLDVLLDQLSPDGPVDLVGHSMGGNVAMLYAGVRPARVRRLVNLEGFGMPATQPAQSPGRFAQWMDELKALHRGDMALQRYADVDGVARRLMKTNPRLSEDRAQWLARQWARPETGADGVVTWRILGDPAHKVTSAQLYRLDEVLEIHRCISAPTLAVEASDDSLSRWWQGRYTLAEYHERLRCVPDCRRAVVAEAGHMLHHDQPRALARLIEDFLA